jgi:hypothetical protein
MPYLGSSIGGPGEKPEEQGFCKIAEVAQLDYGSTVCPQMSGW